MSANLAMADSWASTCAISVLGCGDVWAPKEVGFQEFDGFLFPGEHVVTVEYRTSVLESIEVDHDGLIKIYVFYVKWHQLGKCTLNFKFILNAHFPD